MFVRITRMWIALKNCRLTPVAAFTLIGLAPGQILAQTQSVQSAETPVVAPPAFTNAAAFGSRGVRAHDPSTIVKCGDQYWTFYTGRGIQSYHSKDLIRWEAGPRVFTDPPTWVASTVPENRNAHFWAPDVIRAGNRYLLYYSVSTFGKRLSAIGLVTNPTLDPSDPNYQWTDQGIVVQSSASNNFNAIDPAVAFDAQGKLWMTFGSFWSGIKLIQLDPTTGLRVREDSSMYSLAHNDSIEAAFIARHDGFYYLFVNWGACCRGVNSTYEIRVGRSDKITGPYLDREGVDLLKGGGSLVLASQAPFIGPGHAGIISEKGTNWFSCHFYDGTRRGSPTLSVLPLHWQTNGWPKIEVPTLN
jgi:arabinan endo-1,5-alpha-L-arabinosidase